MSETSTGKVIGITLGSLSVVLVMILATLCYRRKLDRKRQRTCRRKKWSVNLVFFTTKYLSIQLMILLVDVGTIVI